MLVLSGDLGAEAALTTIVRRFKEQQAAAQAAAVEPTAAPSEKPLLLVAPASPPTSPTSLPAPQSPVAPSVPLVTTALTPAAEKPWYKRPMVLAGVGLGGLALGLGAYAMMSR